MEARRKSERSPLKIEPGTVDQWAYDQDDSRDVCDQGIDHGSALEEPPGSASPESPTKSPVGKGGKVSKSPESSPRTRQTTKL